MAYIVNGAGAGAVNIQDGGNSITVDGTITSNAGTGFPPVVTDGVAAGTTGIHVLGTDGINAQIFSTNTSGHVNIADGGNSITVDGTVTANAGTGFPPVVTDGVAAGTTGIHVLGTDGINAQIFSTNTSGHVNIADGGNSITVDGTVTANAGTGFPPVVTDGAAAGTTGIHVLGTDGTNAQLLLTDTLGTQIVTPYAVLSNAVSGFTGDFSDLLDHQVIAAQGVGVRFYATTIVVASKGANTGNISIKDGATVVLTVRMVANVNQTITLPYPLRFSANTAVNASTSNAAQTIDVFIAGFKSTV